METYETVLVGLSLTRRHTNLKPEDFHLDFILFNGDKEIKRQHIRVTKVEEDREIGATFIWFNPTYLKFGKKMTITHYGFSLPGIPAFGKTYFIQTVKKGDTITFEWDSKPIAILSSIKDGEDKVNGVL
ncbi:MAG: hypothetical protein NUW09_01950 [Deltaproteobacteria bacterium]|nr:hypothetical protein [Deltaproteobacteria bacterium]